MEELFDICTIDRKLLGITRERGSKLLENEYHVVVMAIMVNRDGKILLTKRSINKTAPGKWECTAGSVIAGENSKDAMIREIFEEIGIIIKIEYEDPVSYYFEDDGIFDIWKIEISNYLADLKLQKEEVDEAKFATISEIEEIIKSGNATRSLGEVIRLYKCGKIRAKY